MTDYETLTYNSDFGNYGKLDLYPTSSATITTPLVVFIHGGAWRSEDKQEHEQLARYFVEQGFTVAVTNYRLSLYETPGVQPSVQHPHHIQDTYQALTFLHNNPSNTTYDKNRMFLVGHSAGAHIAVSLLLEPEIYRLPFVEGIIGAQGIYDIPLLLKTHPTYKDFVIQAFGQQSYNDASPISKSPTSNVVTPTLIIHSVEDTLVNLDQSQSMEHHLKAIHAPVTLDSTSINGDHYDAIKSVDFVVVCTRFIKGILNGHSD